LRWFRTDEGTTTFLALLKAGYRVRNPEGRVAGVSLENPTRRSL
jgi:hypothetical protein